ncbi:ComF family protein [Propylenella binzhouense]|uniref:ComF family protein n=1 Tax=Propylenella binzhouense TaxID=2555902 RepID=A0A964WUZ3_9HYPH|nr:ComF family protein [Propylenella binzhouense]MYZ49534.1 ComF family protein [Propylenella binzhouense]
MALVQSGPPGSVSRLAAGLVDFLMPPVCPVCRRAVASADALCAGCWSQLRFIAAPLCPVYGTPFQHALGEGAVSAAAMADPPPFGRARAAVLYDGPAPVLVRAMKYRDHPELARMMGRAMAQAGRELLTADVLLVPVPLHRFRLWRRRFNQSALLAAEAGAAAGLPVVCDVLARVRRTRQQVGLSAAQRAKNVEGAFRVCEERRAAIGGRHLVLVDDVYTSGATVKAATRALLRAGAASVDVLTFARVAG